MHHFVTKYFSIAFSCAVFAKVSVACECGIPPARMISHIARPSLNKVKAPPYPWFAKLRIKFVFQNKIDSFICGAVIIDQYYLLTAGHCFKIRGKILKIVVKVGSVNKHDLKKFVAKTHLEHPNFRTIPGNDITLIEMQTPFAFDEQVNKICLPWLPKIIVGQALISPGWGLVHGNDTGFHKTDVLLQSKLFVLPTAPDLDCIENALCMIPDKGEGPCHGDSGGPVVLKHDGRYTVYGIISIGDEELTDEGVINTCKFGEYATDVRKHLSWILKNTPKATYCRPVTTYDADDYDYRFEILQGILTVLSR